VDLGIEGKGALVMGASRGIGRGVAAALAREGAHVAVASRTRERIEAAAEELSTETGGRVLPFVADATDLDSLEQVAGDAADALDGIDILMTNAGGPPAGDPLDFERAEWDAAYRSLVLAPITLIKSVVDGMRQRGWGRVVNVTSTTTRQPIPGLMLSNSHRLAAVGAFKTLANELAQHGILLNSVAPGRIATDRASELSGIPVEELLRRPLSDVPVGRFGRVDEIADVIAFLCSERASYVSGVNLLVDGGLVRAI
jgi:3-oxoacyl-[acyl-carrier protein] reductase